MLRLSYVCILILVSAKCVSQVTEIGAGRRINSSESTAQARRDLEKSYLRIVSPPNDIVDGWEFLPYDYRSRTTPFLYSGEVFSADILMNDRFFRNVPIQYDTYQDDLVYTDTSRMINAQFPKIILRKEVIDSFILHSREGDMRFTKISSPGDQMEILRSGFYELAYTGPTKYMIRHRALIYRRDAINEYEYSPEKFILLDGKWIKVKNQKEFLALFISEKEAIRTFIRQKSIRIRKMNKNDIVMILEYLDKSGNKNTPAG
jgi:hypothetical protein